VVGVENDGDTVGGGNGADVVSGSNGTGDGSLLVLVVDTLTGEVGSTTLGNLLILSVGCPPFCQLQFSLPGG
jgi:hypothetical protein